MPEKSGIYFIYILIKDVFMAFTTNNASVKFGIIGTNFISDMFCDAAKTAGVEICAVYSRKDETGRAFAEKHGIRKVFSDYENFCLSDSFNSCYIASPNFLHFKHVCDMLQSNKHVLCEKPIGINPNQLHDMITLAEKNGLILLEAMRHAYDPSFLIIKEQIKKIGKIRRACFSYCQYSSRYDKFKEGTVLNAFNPELCNAAVMDIGIYCIHMCASLFGMPQKILSSSLFLENGFEAQGSAILKYQDMCADIFYSKITQSYVPSFILGEQGCVTFGHALSKIGEICLYGNDGQKNVLPFKADENNMVYEIRAFKKMVLSGKNDFESLENSLTSMKILEQICKNSGIYFSADK